MEESVDTSKVYEFDATITGEKYYSNDTNYGVYPFSTTEDLPKTAVYSYSFMTEDEGLHHSTLVGKMQRLTIGQTYSVRANLEYSTKYRSWNYKVISAGANTPTTLSEQRAFLLSICTESQADSLLEAYPDIVEGTISGKYGDGLDLSKVKGIKEYYWNLIKTRILDNYVMADILTLLIPLGISYKKVKKLFDGEPNALLLKQRLLDDPYTLVDITSFKNADKIAAKINPDLRVSEKRTVAFLKNYLKELGESEGHTYTYREILYQAVQDNIIECEDFYQMVLEKELENPTFLHIEDERIGLKYYYEIESKIWNKIIEIRDSEPLELMDGDIERGIQSAEEKQGFTFTPEQVEILRNATKNNLVIITGRAGTGKTSLARGLLNIYGHHSIGACALSAKAAKRITEATGFSASTIHRLLGAEGAGSFQYNDLNPLPYDVVFLDEASMVFSGLFWDLLRAIGPRTKLIITGDIAQLPPIGYGLTFGDLLSSDELEINRLSKILRQAEASGIISDSNLIREGVDPIEKKSYKLVRGELQDLVYMFRSERDELNKIAVDTYLHTIESVGIDNCFILTTRRDNAINSTREINRIIQDRLIGEDVPYMHWGEYKKFKLGARVIHTVNDYDKNTFNGDMGVVSYIGKDDEGLDYMQVTYPDKTTDYYRDDLSELELAYCLTVHKFQGSEAKIIIGIIDNSGFMLLDRTMLYTLLTRGKERVLLLAEPYAYDRSIQEDKSGSRNTWTKDFIDPWKN